MSRVLRIDPGDRAVLKKPHPCGSEEWEVLRAGADIKAKCVGCGRIVTLSRLRFERRLKRLVRPAEEGEG